MKRTLKMTVAALAVVGFVGQPIAANAIYNCVPLPPPTTGSPVNPLPMLGVVGFFVCAGFALGKVDADDARGIKKAERGDHARALVGCLLPFHKHKDAVSVKG
jgi:hypothetical protein